MSLPLMGSEFLGWFKNAPSTPKMWNIVACATIVGV